MGCDPCGVGSCVETNAQGEMGESPGDARHRSSLHTLSLRKAKPMSHVTFGGGCFWCTEAVFQQIRGVTGVESGYSGGETVNPSYDEVCTGRTGHAEVIQVTFDPAVVSFEKIVRVHLGTHNPTTKNQQGADRGTQYRSVIFTQSDEERTTAQQLIQEVETALGHPVVTEVKPFTAFYPAEVEHQNYYRRHTGQPYCAAVIEPKLAKFRLAFPEMLGT